MLSYHAVTLFPEMFSALLGCGVIGRAYRRGMFDFSCWNPRDYSQKGVVDDAPYGGGAGMVMMPAPVDAALQAATEAACQASTKPPKVVYLSPTGRPLSHPIAQHLAKESALIVLCGRYEGIDQRIIDTWVDQTISIGDFVVSGGELPAMLLLDAILRQVSGVIGNPDSIQHESFADGLLEHPHYTRPQCYNGACVPEVLVSGNHANVQKWRLEHAVRLTLQHRPDLLDSSHFTEQVRLLIEKILHRPQEPDSTDM